MPAKQFAHIPEELECQPKLEVRRSIGGNLDTIVWVQDRTIAKQLLVC